MADYKQESVTVAELAAAEKKAARSISIKNGYGIALIIAFVIFVVGMVLPHAGEVRGYEAIFGLEAASEANIRLAERVFVILGFAAVVVFNGLAILTRRTVVASIAYILSGMSLFSSLFGLWMRIQHQQVEGAPGVGLGIIFELIAVILLVISYSILIFRRTEEQKALAEQRAQHENLDAVGYAQRSAMVTKQNNVGDYNPLLVDDRRKRATERHQNR